MFDYGKNVRIYAGEDLTQRYYVESSELIILTDTYKITLETLDDNTYFRILDPHVGVKKYSMNIDEDGKKKKGDLKYYSNYIPADRCLNDIFLKNVEIYNLVNVRIEDTDTIEGTIIWGENYDEYFDYNQYSLKPISLLIRREEVYVGDRLTLQFKRKSEENYNYRIYLTKENECMKDWDSPPKEVSTLSRIKVSIEDVIR